MLIPARSRFHALWCSEPYWVAITRALPPNIHLAYFLIIYICGTIKASSLWFVILRDNKMHCCETSTIWCCNKAQGQRTEAPFPKEAIEPEPLKFKLLSMIGLKNFLLNKFIFSRQQMNYRIENWKIYIKDQPYQPPPKYRYMVAMLEEGTRVSIPFVTLTRFPKQCNLTVIYSHGNSSDLAHSLSFITKFGEMHDQVNYLVYDYSGYGNSNATEVTEESICEDLRRMVADVVDRTGGEVILWGFSLGAFPTVRVASDQAFAYRSSIKGVILQSPFASIYSLFTENLTAQSTFENDCFSTLQHIHRVAGTLLIIHSRNDEIVPYCNAKSLYDKYQLLNSRQAYFIEIVNLRHNEVHRYLIDKVENPLVKLFNSHFTHMISRNKELTKAEALRLQKQKYFTQELLSMNGALQIELDKPIQHQPYHPISPANKSSLKRRMETESQVGDEAQIDGIRDLIDSQIYIPGRFEPVKRVKRSRVVNESRSMGTLHPEMGSLQNKVCFNPVAPSVGDEGYEGREWSISEEGDNPNITPNYTPFRENYFN